MRNTIKIAFLLSILILSFSEKLDYVNESNWGSEVCKSGKHQSPINLPKKEQCEPVNQVSIEEISYTPVINEKLQYFHDYKFMVDTSKNGYIKIKKEGEIFKFNLHDIHFHLNSEHTIDGVLYKMEAHLVHTLDKECQDKTGKNQYLVIGLIFDSSVTNQVYDKTPFLKLFNFDTQEVIPELKFNEFYEDINNTFYFYEGGLTTPGCDETVNWIVVDKIFGMNSEVFTIFKNYVGQYYPDGNNRKIQALNDRTIYYVDNSKVVQSKSESQKTFYWKIVTIFVIIALLLYICKDYNKNVKIEENTEKQNDNYQQLREVSVKENSKNKDN